MQFKTLALALLASMVSAQSACFDLGDCILYGGGQCEKASGQLLGTCAPSGASSTLATATATGSAAASATGATCFDDGDCILSGGTCVTPSGSITGTCQAS